MMAMVGWARLLGNPGVWASLAIMAILVLPGFFTLPPVDRDEVLFAQSSAQMLQSGDFVDIRFAGEPRYKKPVGIYWLQAGAAYLTGQADQIWSYRMVSLFGSMIAVGFTFGIARLVMPQRWAFLAAMALAASFLLGGEARLAKTDAVLLACIMGSQFVLARSFLPDGAAQVPRLSFRWAMGFWLALSAGILVKGPIGPLVVGLTVAGLCIIRRDLAIWRSLRPGWGIPVVLAVVSPWLIAITLQSEGAFWQASVGADLIAKLGTAQESHGMPPGTYAALVWFTFWPGSMLLAGGLGVLWRERSTPLVAFSAVWLLPGWIIFEATSTKLIHYVLPTYPALAVAVAYALWRGAPARLWLSILMAAPPLLLLAAIHVAGQSVRIDLPPVFWVMAAGFGMTLPILVYAHWRGEPLALGLAMALSGLALSATIYPSLARISALWPAGQIADLAAAHPGCDLRIAGYAEPSVVFATANRVQFVTVTEAADSAENARCQLIGITGDLIAEFLAARPHALPVARIEGFNLGLGQPAVLQMYLSGSGQTP